MGRANRARDTGPELRLRSALHRRGLRYRVHRRVEPDVRCTADIVFRSARVAVFVDGCFWHRCPEHAILPKGNAAWWSEKLRANVERDHRNDAALLNRGWMVIRVWEHEDVEDAAERIARMIDYRRRSSMSS
jgi:DNA mismatch endonuclease (patch repair protein)